LVQVTDGHHVIVVGVITACTTNHIIPSYKVGEILLECLMDELQAPLDMIMCNAFYGRPIVFTDGVKGLGQDIVTDIDQLDVDALQVPSSIIDLIEED